MGTSSLYDYGASIAPDGDFQRLLEVLSSETLLCSVTFQDL
jgi:hypothetical protein